MFPPNRFMVQKEKKKLKKGRRNRRVFGSVVAVAF
jgi:hypothetical protein